MATLGVNVHLKDTSSAYGNLSLLATELRYLDFVNLRDNTLPGQDLTSYETMASEGFKFDLVLGCGSTGEEFGDGGIAALLSVVDQLETDVPGSVIGVEGLNEPYNFPQLWNGQPTSTWAIVEEVQQAEYAAVHADLNLVGIPLLDTSTDPGDLPGTAPDLSAYSDLGNAHVYPYGGGQPPVVLDSILSGQAQVVPGKPVWITEFGYGDAPQDATYGLDAATQAKNVINGLLDANVAGVQQSFIYELNDYVTTSSSAWDLNGLFMPDGTSKPVADAIHALTTIIADTGSTAGTFQPTPLGYSVDNLPSTGSSLSLARSDGSYVVLVWNDAPDWDPNSQSEIAVTPTTVTVTLGAAANATVYDPTMGTSAIQTLGNVSSVPLSLTDHVLIVDLR